MSHELIKIQNLKKHVEVLATKIGERNIATPEALHRAQHYISEQFKLMGFDVDAHEYKAKGVLSSNIEVTQAGSDKSNQVILLGAHFDTAKGCPGANDSASGIATLLEVARGIKQSQTKTSIRFVAFTNEEPPLFSTEHMGSWRYARMARQRGDNIKAAIILDSLGFYTEAEDSQMHPPLLQKFYPGKGNFAALISNFHSYWEMRFYAQHFKRQISFPLRKITLPNIIPGLGWADHNPFWLHGYRSFTITDTAGYRYPYHHSPRDTAEKVNYAKLAEIATATLRSLQLQ